MVSIFLAPPTPQDQERRAGNPNGPLTPRYRKEAGSTLVEAMLALAIVALAFSSLFMVYSTGLGMVRSQQENVHATLLLEQRCAALRAASWTSLSDADRLKQTVYQTASPSESHLPQLIEEISLRPYALTPPTATPLILHYEPGSAPITTSPATTALTSATCIRADISLSWKSRKGRTTRQTSLVLSLGGTGK